MSNWLGIDFGTSNSAAAYLSDGQVVRVELEAGADVIPTAVFFDFQGQQILHGTAANKALIDGLDGRYMRSLKSVLGTGLMHEKRQLLGRRLDFFEIITGFLALLKNRAERDAGIKFDHVVAGRPVFFYREDAGKDKAAQRDLETCYLNAGFSSVKFLYEPEAAAMASAGNAPDDAIGLVVDIGGGTSDFTLFRSERAGVKIIFSNGLRLGGTHFDRQINFDHFMPLLGRGHNLKRRFADGVMQAPKRIFADLSTWEKIPFLYDRKSKLLVESMVRDAVEPHVFSRLLKALDMRLGHDLAFLAEETKMSYNRQSEGSIVNLSLIEANLNTHLSIDNFDNSLSRYGIQIAEALSETLEKGNTDANDVESVITVGGSSSMGIVTDAIDGCLPNTQIQQGAVFTSIVDGLAIATQMAEK